MFMTDYAGIWGEEQEDELIERELKFLVKPENLESVRFMVDNHNDSYGIEQYFVSAQTGVSLRVRKSTKNKRATFQHAVKYHRSEGDCWEFEQDISEGAYKEIKNRAEGYTKKKRMALPCEFGKFRAIMEIDVFEKENDGLILVEVEYLSERDKKSVLDNLPDWIGENVTKDRRYSNKHLATNPWKKWS